MSEDIEHLIYENKDERGFPEASGAGFRAARRYNP
jgi:hypothetical protein